MPCPLFLMLNIPMHTCVLQTASPCTSLRAFSGHQCPLCLAMWLLARVPQTSNNAAGHKNPASIPLGRNNSEPRVPRWLPESSSGIKLQLSVISIQRPSLVGHPPFPLACPQPPTGVSQELLPHKQLLVPPCVKVQIKAQVTVKGTTRRAALVGDEVEGDCSVTILLGLLTFGLYPWIFCLKIKYVFKKLPKICTLND